jgi:Glucose-6-phosphate dehydrogenase subunit C-terminal domain
VEDAVSDDRQWTLLPGSIEVSFPEIEDALADLARGATPGKRAPARASSGTLIVVGSRDKLVSAVGALAELSAASGVRAIVVSEGNETTPMVRMTHSMIAIEGLAPRYLNNAVAALRLPCLPALVWWRGGSVQALRDVTSLADRVVLDTEDPEEVWEQVEDLIDQTALTDLRWTRLTRWRALLAHLFDLPQVRAAIGSFRRAKVETGDLPSGRLFAGWLMSSLRWSGVDIQIRSVQSDDCSPLEFVRLEGDGPSIEIRSLAGRDCLEATVEGEVGDVRIAPLGDRTLSAWIGEELALRSRDLAFERALAALRKLAA